MAEQKKNQPIQISEINNSSEKLSQFIYEHGKTAGYLLLTALVVISLITYFVKHQQSQSLDQFTQAEKDLRDYSLMGNEEKLTNLIAILNQDPSLIQKYDGLLAQALIVHGKADLAEKYGALALQKLDQEELTLFKEFTETTILISQNKLNDALKNATALQKKLNPEITTLYTLNLLRIGFLYQALGQTKEELATWIKVRTDAQQYASVGAVLDHIHEGNISLLSYLSHREQNLK